MATSDEYPNNDINILEHDMRELRLIMIGPTGSGKSKTGNTILGKDHFESKMRAVSVTSKCQLGTGVRFNREVVIVDTPGVFDTRKDNQHIAKEIMKCIAMTTPGPHAFLLVLNLSTRFSLENKESVDFFVKHFGDNLFDYLVVVFTRKDELEQDHTTIEKFLKVIPVELKNVLEKCGNKYFAINNRANDREKETQISELFQMIDQMLEKKNGQHYKNDFIDATEKIVQNQIVKNQKSARENLKGQLAEVFKNRDYIEEQEFKVLPKRKEEEMRRPLLGNDVHELKILVQEKTKSTNQQKTEELNMIAATRMRSTTLRNDVRRQIQNEDSDVMGWLWEGTKTLLKIGYVFGTICLLAVDFYNGIIKQTDNNALPSGFAEVKNQSKK